MKHVNTVILIDSEAYKIDRRVRALATDLAGDKLPAVLNEAARFISEGKSVHRALADALHLLKLAGR